MSRTECAHATSDHKLQIIIFSEISIAFLLPQVWEYGIQKEKTEEVEGERLHEFKLAGTPWVGEGEESTMCRQGKSILIIII